MHPQAPARTHSVVSTALVLVAFTSALLTVPVLSRPAAAAEVNTVTNIRVLPQDSDDQLSVGDGVEIQAEWSAPEGVRAGDHFSIDLPTFLSGRAGTFALSLSSADTNGSAGKEEGTGSAGECTVTDHDMQCTFSDYLESHTGLKGDLTFFANATQPADAETWSFGTGGRTLRADVPGGVTESTPLTPDRGVLTARQSANGSITWQAVISGDELWKSYDDNLPGYRPVVMNASIDSRLPQQETDPTIEAATAEQIRDRDWTTLHEGFGPADYQLERRTSGFTFFTNSDRLRERWYRITFHTAVPDGAADAESFTTSITADDNTFLDAEQKVRFASGSATGTPRSGRLEWTAQSPTGATLPHTEWIVTGPDGTQALIADNGENDSNPDQGKLRIAGLRWGDYSLQLDRPAPGYLASDEVHERTIGAQGIRQTVSTVLEPAAGGRP